MLYVFFFFFFFFFFYEKQIKQATRISDDIKNQLLDASLKELHTNLQEYTSKCAKYNINQKCNIKLFVSVKYLGYVGSF